MKTVCTVGVQTQKRAAQTSAITNYFGPATVSIEIKI